MKHILFYISQISPEVEQLEDEPDFTTGKTGTKTQLLELKNIYQ